MEVVPESTTSAVSAPTSEQIAELRGVAVHLAQIAAAHVRLRRIQVRGAAGALRADAVQSKSTPTDPVTVVDTETEELIRDLLAELRPGERVFGEEGGGSVGDGSQIVWVVDPIDGTVNFMYGIPAYSVSVAAMRDGR